MYVLAFLFYYEGNRKGPGVGVGEKRDGGLKGK